MDSNGNVTTVTSSNEASQMAVHGLEPEQLSQSFAPMLSPGLSHLVLNNRPLTA
jgi:hypothetical protein